MKRFITLLLIFTANLTFAQKITTVSKSDTIVRHHQPVEIDAKSWVSASESGNVYYISFIKIQRSKSKEVFKHNKMSIFFSSGSTLDLNKSKEYWEEYDDEFYQHTIIFKIDSKNLMMFKEMPISSYTLLGKTYDTKDTYIISKQLKHLIKEMPKK